jgi:S1-C subfamily serine protease
MAEQPEAAYGADEPHDQPVFPTAGDEGTSGWDDLAAGAGPQWPGAAQAWPTSGGVGGAGGAARGDQAAAPFGTGDGVVGGTPGWRVPGTAPAPEDDTWHGDSWRGDTWHDGMAPVGLPAPAPNGGRGRRRWSVPVVLIATALVAGGAGAGIALALTRNGTSPSRSAALPSSGHRVPLSSNPQSLNVHSIASLVDPATVDITAKGSAGQDQGTGMILSASGLVLTNNHVIDGSSVVTAQVDGKGRTYSAVVLGTDLHADVALLQLKAGPGFESVSVGNSNAITVGDPVVAIGNALGLPGPETVTNGIISATGRSITVGDPSSGATESLTNMFQSSAAINPGNSGGPLVDANGQVIGMNTAEASGSGDGQSASNVGFAIPINAAMSIARQIQAGKVSATVQVGPHAIVGVEVVTVACAEGNDGCSALGGSSAFGFLGGSTYKAPVNRGAVVAGVEQGDPAQAVGIAAGDVITSVNGSPIDSPTDLTKYMNFQKVGERATVQWVDPNGHRRSATVSLVEGPNV